MYRDCVYTNFVKFHKIVKSRKYHRTIHDPCIVISDRCSVSKYGGNSLQSFVWQWISIDILQDYSNLLWHITITIVYDNSKLQGPQDRSGTSGIVRLPYRLRLPKISNLLRPFLNVPRQSVISLAATARNFSIFRNLRDILSFSFPLARIIQSRGV